MGIGVKNEHGETHIVSGFAGWSELLNKDTNGKNRTAFYFPRVEFFLQCLNFLLGTTLFQVIETLGKLSIFPAILAYFLT